MNQPIQRKSALRRLLRDTICGLERRFGPGGALHPLVQSACFQLLQLDEWVLRLERAYRKKAAAKGLQGKEPSTVDQALPPAGALTGPSRKHHL